MMLRSRTAFSDYLELVGLSERGLAKAAGLGHATVNHLMTGRRTTCTAHTSVAIETALACPVNLLFMPESDEDEVAVQRELRSILRTRQVIGVGM